MSIERRVLLAGLAGVLLLAGCGRKGPLQPPPGDEESAAEMEADDRDTAGSVDMDQADEEDQ